MRFFMQRGPDRSSHFQTSSPSTSTERLNDFPKSSHPDISLSKDWVDFWLVGNREEFQDSLIGFCFSLFSKRLRKRSIEARNLRRSHFSARPGICWQESRPARRHRRMRFGGLEQHASTVLPEVEGDERRCMSVCPAIWLD